MFSFLLIIIHKLNREAFITLLKIIAELFNINRSALGKILFSIIAYINRSTVNIIIQIMKS
ncbi:hypothetical protein CDLVIII_4148 [Clostridium sp. DL-VIII]|nr:hypothetical protein CDLVIII_4148 [Clostridium sp. DL-VIII]